jgi:ring-1,2-phenylacetyl-CoA epoxidase subunit PaaE
VKRIANGEFSRWLFDRAKVGDALQTIGASGFFTLPNDLPDDTTLFFLAAGSGITPIFSLLREVLCQRKQPVVLVYSSRSERETIFYRELRVLENQFPDRLSIVFLFSGSKNLNRARLSIPLLTELLRQHVADKTKALAYLCGPHDYMQMARIALLTENISPENIRTEQFKTDKPSIAELPPDQDQHLVTITYQGKKFSLTVKYPNTILQTAKLLGVELPYSCEAGRCGTCAATCVKGKIWMSRNEVLLDKEMAKGRVLTCTGYPVGGDAELIVNG